MKMYYEVYGTGAPLVLLHWYDGTGSASWQPFIEKLSSEYRLIIPDLRGHGRTRNPTDTFLISQCAKDISGLLDHLEVTTFDAMGASLGGMSLLHLATQDPDRIRSMILIGSPHYLSEEARNTMRKEASKFYRDQPKKFRYMSKIHSGGEKQVTKLARLFGELADKYDEVNFTPPLLSTIKARTLIVSGDDDPFVTPQISVEMHKSIKHSTLWIVPAGGHLPHMDLTEEFLGQSLKFLNANER